MDIAAWLDSLGLGQNEQAFRDDEIDVEISGRDLPRVPAAVWISCELRIWADEEARGK